MWNFRLSERISTYPPRLLAPFDGELRNLAVGGLLERFPSGRGVTALQVPVAEGWLTATAASKIQFA